MDMGNMGKKIIYIAILSLSLIALVTGCKKNKKSIDPSQIANLVANESSPAEISTKPQSWHVTDKRILVILGYGFNDATIVSELKDCLEENFGLDEENGLVKVQVFPDDFKRGNRFYPSELYSKIQETEKELSGIVILGAPENTHIALARNQDAWNQEVPYPVIALFPQDEVLGLEATCDIVLDKGQSVSLTGEIDPSEIESQLAQESPEILVETIKYIQSLNYSLEKTSSIQVHLMQMLQNKNIRHYIDPESGLQSINHFILD